MLMPLILFRHQQPLYIISIFPLYFHSIIILRTIFYLIYNQLILSMLLCKIKQFIQQSTFFYNITSISFNKMHDEQFKYQFAIFLWGGKFYSQFGRLILGFLCVLHGCQINLQKLALNNKQKYNNNKLNNIKMQSVMRPSSVDSNNLSEHSGRKRKGISVSLSPFKQPEAQIPLNNGYNISIIPSNLQQAMPPQQVRSGHPIQPQAINQIPLIQASPRNETNSSVHLSQSYVRFQEDPFRQYPKYVRVMPVSRVNFTHHSPSIQASGSQTMHPQLKQAQVLDKQMQILKKQIQAKKQNIASLQQQHYVNNQKQKNKQKQQSKTSAYLVNKFKQQLNIGQKNQVNKAQLNIVTARSIYEQQENERIQITSRKNQSYHSPKVQINPKLTNTTNKNKQSTTVSQIQNNRNISPSKAVSPGKRQQKTSIIVNSFKPDGDESSAQLTTEVKRVQNKEKEKEKQKQNNQTLQRMEKLKWAEQRLLDIIRVCDHGL